jgi:hypothetical protein
MTIENRFTKKDLPRISQATIEQAYINIVTDPNYNYPRQSPRKRIINIPYPVTPDPESILPPSLIRWPK